ncbi:MAG: hypothetical protein AB8B61_05805 [Cyclobacteriaceae bacterium]
MKSIFVSKQSRLEAHDFEALKQVALAVGFSTTPYFCKLYEARYGKHPSEYSRNE